MIASPRKNKTDYLIDGLIGKDLKNFEKLLTALTNRAGFVDFWKNRNMYRSAVPASQHKQAEHASDKRSHHLSRKFYSDFNKLLENFYVYTSVNKDEQGRMIYLLREMRKRNLDKLFSDILSEVKRYHKHKIKKGFVHNITLLSSYYEEYFISHAMNDEDNLIKISSQINETSQNILIQKILFENINRKLYSGIINLENEISLVKYDHAVRFVESKLQYFRTKHENIYLLYLISSMIDKSGDEQEAAKVLKYLRSSQRKFTPEFLYLAYENILRYLLSRINRGIQPSLMLAFEMVKEIEAKGVLKQVPHIQPLDFFAIVNIFVRMERLDLGEKFIDNYSGKLIYDSRKEILNVSSAIIEFAKGNFTESKNMLAKVKTKSLSLYLFSKAALVKSMYEKNELIAIASVSDTVKHFLNRKKELTPFYKDSIFRFFSYINRLAYTRRNNGKGIARIQTDLEKETTFYQKRWIDEKFAELRLLYPER